MTALEAHRALLPTVFEIHSCVVFRQLTPIVICRVNFDVMQVNSGLVV